MQARFLLPRVAMIFVCILFLGNVLGNAASAVRARVEQAPAARVQIVIHPTTSLGAFDNRMLGSNLAMWLGDNRTRASISTE